MCGLIGFISTEDFKGAKKRGDLLAEGLIASMFRGWQSTGLALIQKGKEKNHPFVYKDELCAFDFIHRPLVHKVLENPEKYSALLGHTRSATVATVSQRNAHPFQYNHITMMHNGHVTNAWELNKGSKEDRSITVDSDHVAYALGHNDDKRDEEAVLEKLMGDFALVWHNTKDGTINIARNEGRPFYFAYVEKENTMVYASEITLLCHLLERRGMEIEDIILEPKFNTWYKFPIDNVRGVTQRPFVPSLSRIRHMGGGAVTTHTEKTTTTETQRGSEASFRTPTPEEMAEASAKLRNANRIDVHDPKVAKEYLQRNKAQIQKSSGHPTTIKKLQYAAKKLEHLKHYFFQADTMMITRWVEYKNNKGFGYAFGYSIAGESYLMQNVPEYRWEKYKDFKKVYVNMVNVRKMEDGKEYIVVAEHAAHEKMFEKWKNAAHNPGTEDKGHGDDRPFLGPNGHYVSRSRWFELTRKGCGNCDGVLSLDKAPQLHWHGDAPICMECQEDEDFWVYNRDPNAPLHRITLSDYQSIH